MEKILLISPSTSLEDRITNLVDSPRHVARVSSWKEARRLLSKAVPATVVVDSELVSDPMAGTELVHLNNVLKKDQKSAFLLSDDELCEQWLEMFEAIDEAISPPSSPREWIALRDRLMAQLPDSSEDTSLEPTSSAPSSQAEEVIIRLPQITSGSLSSLSIGRVMYCLHHRQATGLLHLSSGSVERSFAFRDGAFVDHASHDDTRTLTGAYAWSDGHFKFVDHPPLPGPTNSIYLLIKKGLVTHRSQRQLMNGLMSRMSTYPVITQLWSQRCDAIDWDVLHRFSELCDGQQNLEAIFSKMGSQVTEAFRAAAFCRDTDLVVFRGQPTTGPLHIQYDDSGATTSNSTSSRSDESSSSPSSKSSHKELSAKELASRFQKMKRQSPHEIFGIWKGCGREVVKETYYSMVKKHHPDVYGGNVDNDVRDYAQKIFVQIRNSYTELLQIEGEQTAPPPGEDAKTQPTKRPAKRKRLTTLHPGQSSPQPQQTNRQRPNRKKSSTPIAMGRTPTSVHPDLEQQLGDESSAPRRASSSPGKQRAPTPPPSVGARPSAEGLGDPTSDPEWRREQLERLQKKSSTPKRRSTPISTTKNSAASSEDPARDAFNLGYKKFKKHLYSEALPHFDNAQKLDSDRSLYTTFYAYCLFQTDADRAKEARKLLKDVIRQEDRQSLPDAHLFLGHILKARDREHQAYKHFKKALQLNPASRDAEREIRLYERRHGKGDKSGKSKSGGFFKKLFKD